jgi:hypothetical protein
MEQVAVPLPRGAWRCCWCGQISRGERHRPPQPFRTPEDRHGSRLANDLGVQLRLPTVGPTCPDHLHPGLELTRPTLIPKTRSSAPRRLPVRLTILAFNCEREMERSDRSTVSCNAGSCRGAPSVDTPVRPHGSSQGRGSRGKANLRFRDAAMAGPRRRRSASASARGQADGRPSASRWQRQRCSQLDPRECGSEAHRAPGPAAHEHIHRMRNDGGEAPTRRTTTAPPAGSLPGG